PLTLLCGSLPLHAALPIFVIDRAEGRALAAGPTELRASGVFEGHPYRLRLEGGPLAVLAQADAPWPLELFAEGLDASLVVAGSRSEEHTSELQSRDNLVCR